MHHPVLSQKMTSTECNLVKTIAGPLPEQRKLLDLKRSHLEEKYPLLLPSVSDEISDTTGYWLREDDVGLVHVL